MTTEGTDLIEQVRTALLEKILAYCEPSRGYIPPEELSVLAETWATLYR